MENWNNPEVESFAEICYINENGTTRAGFRFNERLKPHKKLPELYAQHIRKSRLGNKSL